MKIEDRFIEYVKIDTTSDEHSKTTPSTDIQYDLAKMLEKQLKDLGLKDVYIDQGYVYGTLEANSSEYERVVGFIAHMDTAFDFSGTNVNPRIIRNYNGDDVKLNGQYTLNIDQFQSLKSFIGDDIIVTDGSTLLGADDKAGIAIIMQALEYLISHPEIKHGTIKIGFTPDEEIGRGADHFDVKKFGADFAYTLDGGLPDELCFETFNAYKVDVNVSGEAIHPGSAKDKMINALSVSNEFDRLLPCNIRPEYTSGYEGFNHLYHMSGSVQEAKMEYIVRNHDSDIIQSQLADFENAKEYINNKYRKDIISLVVNQQYQNMKEILKDKQAILEIARSAIKDNNLEVKERAARGGTDGARLTFMGLPCPNLGTGSINHHGPYECASINAMNKMVDIVLSIVQKVKEI